MDQFTSKKTETISGIFYTCRRLHFTSRNASFRW